MVDLEGGHLEENEKDKDGMPPADDDGELVHKVARKNGVKDVEADPITQRPSHEGCRSSETAVDRDDECDDQSEHDDHRGRCEDHGYEDKGKVSDVHEGVVHKVDDPSSTPHERHKVQERNESSKVVGHHDLCEEAIESDRAEENSSISDGHPEDDVELDEVIVRNPIEHPVDKGKTLDQKDKGISDPVVQPLDTLLAQVHGPLVKVEIGGTCD